jgi:hypothetical protein
MRRYLEGGVMTDIYVGSKIIKAWEMDEKSFLKTYKNQEFKGESRAGYTVVYPDGYISWSPKETFEIAYRKVTEEEKDMVGYA